MALRLINPSRRPLLHVPRPFSSSSSSSNNNNNPPFPLQPPPPPSDDPGASPLHPPPNHGDAPHASAPSLFSDIRDRLQSSPAPPPPRRIPNNPFRPAVPPAAPSLALDDIKRSLQSFRNNSSRSSAPRDAGVGVGGGAPPSFQDVLRNNAAPPAGSPQAGAPNAGDGKSFAMNFDSIRRNIRNIDPQQRQRQPNSTFLTNPPEGLFGKDTQERVRKPQPGQGKEQADAGIFLAKDYSPEELGKKLAELRPADAGKDGKEWFSLEELQGRIAKLAELERSQENPQFGMPFGFLRQTLKGLEKNEQKKHVKTVQGMSIFANIGGKPLPDYMLNNLPPQEELLERYFHPDHMSGEEKMKLELQKVRDEFKMSENDCGSARVQIAQLTLKIKHLSSVLHKKDKHSRKGQVPAQDRLGLVLPRPVKAGAPRHARVQGARLQEDAADQGAVEEEQEQEEAEDEGLELRCAGLMMIFHILLLPFGLELDRPQGWTDAETRLEMSWSGLCSVVIF